MIGPTGVGKTEIARRLAKLANAPFIKIEATKFTEVGYVGRDVDSIIRDLAETAIKESRERETRKKQPLAEDRAETVFSMPCYRLLGTFDLNSNTEDRDSATRQKFRKKLREGDLDDKEIEIEVAAPRANMEIFCPAWNGRSDIADSRNVQNMTGDKKKTRKLTIREARKMLLEEEAAKMINDEELKLTRYRT